MFTDLYIYYKAKETYYKAKETYYKENCAPRMPSAPGPCAPVCLCLYVCVCVCVHVHACVRVLKRNSPTPIPKLNPKP